MGGLLSTAHALRTKAVHISMPHDRPERRYGYPVTPAHDQVVNSPPNRANSSRPAERTLANRMGTNRMRWSSRESGIAAVDSST
jgi:hypothetical protein